MAHGNEPTAIPIVTTRIAFASALYAAICIPAIFAAEWLGLPESWIHTTQLLAVLVMVTSSAVVLYLSRGAAPSWPRRLLFLLFGLGLAWVVFFVVLVLYLVLLPWGPDTY